jgi:Ser/Thr protein kinase RdoA (MazF antagonist)
MNFSELLPKTIFDSVFAQGLHPTGALFPLNSYENRVYEIGVEDHEPIVAKYYRPGRWSVEAIAEEHMFIDACAVAEIPVVAPLPLQQHVSQLNTIGQTGELFYTFYPKFRGREHQEITNEDRQWLGRTLARLHNVGEFFKTKHRLHLTPETYGYESLDFILDQPFLPDDILDSLETCLVQSLELLEPYFYESLPMIAVHGDCHPGNILWNPEGPHLLDFDDMIIAPPVQDLWMLFNGDAAEVEEQRNAFFDGYETFREFDYDTFVLTEPLRTLRMIRYAAWIGQRYEEAAFQRAFPYYQERRYWEEFLLSIKEQISLLQELGT